VGYGPQALIPPPKTQKKAETGRERKRRRKR